jgi:hypothetical protein
MRSSPLASATPVRTARGRGWRACLSQLNGKRTPRYQCRMVAWSPALRYSVEDLVDGLQ